MSYPHTLDPNSGCSPELAQRAWQVLQDYDAKQAKRNEAGAGYEFETLSEFFGSEDHAKVWIVKGAVAWGETTAWIGAPGSLKSALMADLSISVAFNRGWHGKKTMGGGVGVLYFALERADLVKRRIQAEITSLGLKPDGEDASITVVKTMVDLFQPESVQKVIRTIRNVEVYTGDTIGLVIFDTFAKVMAASGLDEDRAKDQGKLFANIERVKEATGRPHIALVGHTGKDESRGARGSNTIYGDVDVMVTITGSEVKTATVTKANDLPEGRLFSFKGAIHQFGPDDDGDPITVNYVVPAEGVQTSDNSAPKRKLSDNQKLAIEGLAEVVLSDGKPAPASMQLPAGTKVVAIEAWKDELYRRGVLSDEDSNPRTTFKRLRENLITKAKIGQRDDHVWLVRSEL